VFLPTPFVEHSQSKFRGLVYNRLTNQRQKGCVGQGNKTEKFGFQLGGAVR